MILEMGDLRFETGLRVAFGQLAPAARKCTWLQVVDETGRTTELEVHVDRPLGFHHADASDASDGGLSGPATPLVGALPPMPRLSSTLTALWTGGRRDEPRRSHGKFAGSCR